MTITPRRGRLVLATALAAVLGLASPAWAATSSTTVTASPQSTEVGDPVQLQATVDCPADPTGGLGVTFFDNGDLLDTLDVDANGQVSYTATFSTVGTHTIIAAYNGNANCDASNSSTTVQVTAAPTPPGPTPTPCLLACGGLINFSVGDITNNINTSAHRYRSQIQRHPH